MRDTNENREKSLEREARFHARGHSFASRTTAYQSERGSTRSLFCPVKPEIARFFIGFRFNNLDRSCNIRLQILITSSIKLQSDTPVTKRCIYISNQEIQWFQSLSLQKQLEGSFLGLKESSE